MKINPKDMSPRWASLYIFFHPILFFGQIPLEKALDTQQMKTRVNKIS